jgi:RHS repeat-associated protein
VPRTTATEKYSWLGADEVPTELPTGIIGMGARSYIPQLGRFEQTDPQPGGLANAYAYTDDDPVNESDLSGDYTSTVTYDYEAAELGPAAPGLPQEYAGPGAIFPPSVNMQVEEEFNAHPPWDAVSAYVGGLLGGDNGRWNGINPGLEDCSGGCHTTPGQEKCLKKAGDNKSQGSKCFAGQHGHIGELAEPASEIWGIGECILADGNCPDFGAPPHPSS